MFNIHFITPTPALSRWEARRHTPMDSVKVGEWIPDQIRNDGLGLGWTFRISSGVSEGIDKSVVQSDWEFLRIGVDSRR